jgi:hypothetical protein
LTEFDQKLRHYCRHLKCRSKLPTAVENHREAFCARGCYNGFYLRRCRVCEAPIEQPTRGGTRLICKKAKCRNAWDNGDGFGRFAESTNASPNAKATQEVPAYGQLLSGSKPVERARPWRQIAGPPLTPSQFHCATLGGSARDEVLRVEAKNRAALKAAEETEIETDGEFTEPDWREAISPDGVKCFVTREATPPVPTVHQPPADIPST